MPKISKILLVEPDFPYPSKSRNKANSIHKNFVPVGLLKLGAYYRSRHYKVKLVRGNHPKNRFRSFEPSLILVTSIFTYWSRYVWEAVEHYRGLFPEAKIIVGGIYATLHHNKKYFQNKLKVYRAKCHVGLHKSAEKYYPDCTLLKGSVDHHVTHAMRGCVRRCKFCGVWKIEPERRDKTPSELVKEIKTIGKHRVIFFDNNFLANKHIKEILVELGGLRVNNRAFMFESQSGFDGRILEKSPELAQLLKEARFQNVKIAWDNSLSDAPAIKRQLSYLTKAGYNPKDISVFMIYNYDISYKDMVRKLRYCEKWGVQITDCRFRPLDSVQDRYDPTKFRTGQTGDDYYIHEKSGWTDQKIRDFRKGVRQHNISIRYARDKGLTYDKRMEKWSAIHNTFKFFHMGRPPQLEAIETSPTWQRRLRMMNRVKNYYKKHNLNSLDFSVLTKHRIDEELGKILKRIDLRLEEKVVTAAGQ